MSRFPEYRPFVVKLPGNETDRLAPVGLEEALSIVGNKKNYVKSTKSGLNLSFYLKLCGTRYFSGDDFDRYYMVSVGYGDEGGKWFEFQEINAGFNEFERFSFFF